jgi:hypothetical protein
MGVELARSLCCNDEPEFCPICGGRRYAPMLSTAECRGAHWGERVSRRREAKGKPWPSYDESPRLRNLAMRFVLDLADDPAIREVFARKCAEAARVSYDEAVRIAQSHPSK